MTLWVMAQRNRIWSLSSINDRPNAPLIGRVTNPCIVLLVCLINLAPYVNVCVRVNRIRPLPLGSL